MTTDIGSLPEGLLFTLIFIAILLNGLIVLSNTALNTVNRNKIKQLLHDPDRSKKAEQLVNLLEKPSEYRFTNRLLSYMFIGTGMYFSLQLPYNNALSFALFILCNVTFAEYFTRKLAQQHSMGIAFKVTAMEETLVILLKPFVFLLTVLANMFLRLFRQETNVDFSGYSEETVMSILEEGQQTGAIKEEGKKMINSIFAFDDELAYEIMTPRTDVFVIDINDPVDEYLDELMELRYSRIPVCEDDTDNIIGILNIKDYLIQARTAGFDKVDIRSILRKAYFVPETKNIDSLFIEFQKEKQHIAILIDEYGGFSGIVTMEDIVEEIVGDINDEYDEEEQIVEKVNDNIFIVDGDVSLNDLQEDYNINLVSDTSETIGGFIIDLLGEIPDDGDENREIELDQYMLTILSVRERRIEKVRIEIKALEEAEKEDEQQ
ncbi:MAG: HlyC/CorC family transporter [Firmicutes bacterium]|nr:HlyC/CorC family transporter [Bacillota bacterium]